MAEMQMLCCPNKSLCEPGPSQPAHSSKQGRAIEFECCCVARARHNHASPHVNAQQATHVRPRAHLRSCSSTPSCRNCCMRARVSTTSSPSRLHSSRPNTTTSNRVGVSAGPAARLAALGSSPWGHGVLTQCPRPAREQQRGQHQNNKASGPPPRRLLEGKGITAAAAAPACPVWRQRLPHQPHLHVRLMMAHTAASRTRSSASLQKHWDRHHESRASRANQCTASAQHQQQEPAHARGPR